MRILANLHEYGKKKEQFVNRFLFNQMREFCYPSRTTHLDSIHSENVTPVTMNSTEITVFVEQRRVLLTFQS